MPTTTYQNYLASTPATQTTVPAKTTTASTVKGGSNSATPTVQSILGTSNPSIAQLATLSPSQLQSVGIVNPSLYFSGTGVNYSGGGTGGTVSAGGGSSAGTSGDRTAAQIAATNAAAGNQPINYAPVNPPQPADTTSTPITTAPPVYQGGSVVDAMTALGLPNDFATRQKLASQEGIQNYQGTAQQNTQMLADIKKNWQKYYEANQGRTDLIDGGAARAAIPEATTQPTDPHADLSAAVSSMNPVVQQLYTMIQSYFNPTNTSATLTQQYQDLTNSQGIPALQTQYMNLENVINGQEDDIRTEIQKAGGLGTEGQIQSLATSRNKTLIMQANVLQSAIAQKEDYVNNVMKYSSADRSEIDNQFNTATGALEKLATIQDTQNKNATTGYQKIVDNLGYNYLATHLSPTEKTYAEQLLYLPKGSLSDTSSINDMETIRQKNLALSAQKTNITIQNAGSLDNYRAAKAAASWAGTINSTIKQLYPSTQANPINLYQSSAQWINKLNTAYNNSIDPNNTAKNVSDLELIDAAVKINNGGQQITEAQVNTLLGGTSLKAKVTVKGDKLTGISTILTDDQRKEIQKLATETFTGQKQLADKAVARINAQLTKIGLDSSMLLSGVDDVPVDQYSQLRSQLQSGEILVNRNGQVGAIPASELLDTDTQI